MNFPIYNHKWNFTHQEILSYIQMFSHHCYFSRHQDGVSTYHLFPDGLRIKLDWLESAEERLTFPLCMEKIESLVLRNSLILKAFRYLSFSSDKSLPDEKTFNSFQTLIANHDRKMDRCAYKQEEYYTSSLVSVDDYFFDELIRKYRF